MGRWFLGVDVGSVSLKVVLVDEAGALQYESYARTDGRPLAALVREIDRAQREVTPDVTIGAVGTTGSGRYMAAAYLGADVVKNEITTHAIGALRCDPDIRTIIEIGGQDSKIIHLREGRVCDFAMNTVCAAGTGAFLDQQAERLKIPIEEFGAYALAAKRTVRIAGRCSVFAESDMIHKQQAGYDGSEICRGLCQALVRNYLNNVARGRKLHSPISFQGGVARNRAIVECFREALPDAEIRIPPHVTACGAIGAAVLAGEDVGGGDTAFKGWRTGSFTIRPSTCRSCDNECELFTLLQDGAPTARWGGRCDRGNRLLGQPARATRSGGDPYAHLRPTDPGV
ncbi:MAG: 2-hydroxyglutaryl-CoA dehydratase [Kiritimatiellae bacterium]|nr:2-hydroxyglutaryl-CoA dehydratase [Kiritimatiellia bacterium]